HRLLAATLNEGGPITINFSLILARHLERDRLVEAELRAAVEGEELAAIQDEINRHGLPHALPYRVRGHCCHAGIRKDSGVEACCLFTLRVEPQACCERVHDLLLIS